MKFKHYLATVSLFALALSNFVFSAQPLLLSDWAQQNPGKLPYSSCAIHFPKIHGAAGWVPVIGMSILGPGYLRCISEKHQLVFRIPIEKLYNYSMSAGVSHMMAAIIEFNSDTLNGKKLADLFERYHGGECGAVAVVGGGCFGGFQNSAGIKASFTKINTFSGISLTLGYSTFKPEIPSTYSASEIRDPFYLSDITASVDRRTDSYVTRSPDGSTLLQTKEGETVLGSPRGRIVSEPIGLFTPDDSKIEKSGAKHVVVRDRAGALVLHHVGGSDVFRPNGDKVDLERLKNLVFEKDS